MEITNITNINENININTHNNLLTNYINEKKNTQDNLIINKLNNTNVLKLTQHYSNNMTQQGLFNAINFKEPNSNNLL